MVVGANYVSAGSSDKTSPRSMPPSGRNESPTGLPTSRQRGPPLENGSV